MARPIQRPSRRRVRAHRQISTSNRLSSPGLTGRSSTHRIRDSGRYCMPRLKRGMTTFDSLVCRHLLRPALPANIHFLPRRNTPRGVQIMSRPSERSCGKRSRRVAIVMPLSAMSSRDHFCSLDDRSESPSEMSFGTHRFFHYTSYDTENQHVKIAMSKSSLGAALRSHFLSCGRNQLTPRSATGAIGCLAPADVAKLSQGNKKTCRYLKLRG